MRRIGINRGDGNPASGLGERVERGGKNRVHNSEHVRRRRDPYVVKPDDNSGVVVIELMVSVVVVVECLPVRLEMAVGDGTRMVLVRLVDVFARGYGGQRDAWR